MAFWHIKARLAKAKAAAAKGKGKGAPAKDPAKEKGKGKAGKGGKTGKGKVGPAKGKGAKQGKGQGKPQKAWQPEQPQKYWEEEEKPKYWEKEYSSSSSSKKRVLEEEWEPDWWRQAETEAEKAEKAEKAEAGWSREAKRKKTVPPPPAPSTPGRSPAGPVPAGPALPGRIPAAPVTAVSVPAGPIPAAKPAAKPAATPAAKPFSAGLSPLEYFSNVFRQLRLPLPVAAESWDADASCFELEIDPQWMETPSLSSRRAAWSKGVPGEHFDEARNMPSRFFHGTSIENLEKILILGRFASSQELGRKPHTPDGVYAYPNVGVSNVSHYVDKGCQIQFTATAFATSLKSSRQATTCPEGVAMVMQRSAHKKHGAEGLEWIVHHRSCQILLVRISLAQWTAFLRQQEHGQPEPSKGSAA